MGKSVVSFLFSQQVSIRIFIDASCSIRQSSPSHYFVRARKIYILICRELNNVVQVYFRPRMVNHSLMKKPTGVGYSCKQVILLGENMNSISLESSCWNDILIVIMSESRNTIKKIKNKKLMENILNWEANFTYEIKLNLTYKTFC